MINNNIVKLEQDLIDLINNANVPIATTCLILDKITKEAKAALNKVLEEEKQQQIQPEQ